MVANLSKEGPFGVGDPDDKSLRKVEVEVLIPKKMRDIANKEKCTIEVSEYTQCCKEEGLSMIYKCRPQNTKLWDCLGSWYNNEDFKKTVTAQYLDEREEYRRTGIKKVPVNVRAELMKKRKIEEKLADQNKKT